MRRIRVPLSALADLVLVLAALLGGAGMSHMLPPPISTSLTQGSGVFTSLGEAQVIALGPPVPEAWRTRWLDTSTLRVAADPAPDDLDAHLVVPRTELIPVQQLGVSLARQACTSDWRQDLQQLASWAHVIEAPAGANRYPIAVPDDRQRDDLPCP